MHHRLCCPGCQKVQAVEVSYRVTVGSRRREADSLWPDSGLSLLECLCCLPEQGTWQSRGPITISQVSFTCYVFTDPRHIPSTLSSFHKHWRASRLNLTNISLLEPACLKVGEARQAGQTALLFSSSQACCPDKIPMWLTSPPSLKPENKHLNRIRRKLPLRHKNMVNKVFQVSYTSWGGSVWWPEL